MSLTIHLEKVDWEKVVTPSSEPWTHRKETHEKRYFCSFNTCHEEMLPGSCKLHFLSPLAPLPPSLCRREHVSRDLAVLKPKVSSNYSTSPKASILKMPWQLDLHLTYTLRLSTH